jgi:hypothetical protein
MEYKIDIEKAPFSLVNFTCVKFICRGWDNVCVCLCVVSNGFVLQCV